MNRRRAFQNFDELGEQVERKCENCGRQSIGALSEGTASAGRGQRAATKVRFDDLSGAKQVGRFNLLRALPEKCL